MAKQNTHVESTKYAEGQLVHISNVSDEHTISVKAHLPENFGFSVGSDIGTPFSGLASEGLVAQGLALTTGGTSKQGLVTRRLYLGPDQSDISLELKFEAWSSGADEVVIPVLKLMLMSVGQRRNLPKDVAEYMKRFNVIDGAIEKIEKESKNTIAEEAAKLIRYIRTPGVSTVRIGNTYKLKNVFLSNVSVNFSNVLDSEFFPMSASVSLSLTPQDPIDKNDLVDIFSGMNKYYRRNSEKSESLTSFGNNQ